MSVEEYEVLYDWEPETGEDLGLFAGEFVQVLEKNEHGWWLGTIDRDGELVRGYFPKNYVKEKPRVRDAPKPPPRPVSMVSSPGANTQTHTPSPLSPASPGGSASAPTATGAAVEQLAKGVKAVTVAEGPSLSAAQGAPFCLRTLAAFDELASKGYAVEMNTEAQSGAKAGLVGVAGQQVEMEVTAKTWDGSRALAIPFCQGVVKCVIGRREVIPGLEIAAQLIAERQQASIVCAPKMAYGAAGFPPHVPPNSFVVFEVRVLGIADPPRGVPAAVQGPSELLTSGVVSSRANTHTANKAHARRDSTKLVFVPAGEQTAGHAKA